MCETRLIKLVVTHLSVTDEVNNNVVVEFLPVLGSNFKCPMDVFQGVSVYMENWCVDGFGKITGIHSTSTLLGDGRETNLIVDDDVDCSTDGVVWEVLHLKGLVADTLPRESCVTVNQDWYDLVSADEVFLAGASLMILSSASSHNDRVDTLQMGGVCQYLYVHLCAIWI